jgi:hypothetical protein
MLIAAEEAFHAILHQSTEEVAVAFNGNGVCSECYESGYRDAFDTIIEYIISESPDRDMLVDDLRRLLSRDLGPAIAG